MLHETITKRKEKKKKMLLETHTKMYILSAINIFKANALKNLNLFHKMTELNQIIFLLKKDEYLTMKDFYKPLSNTNRA